MALDCRDCNAPLGLQHTDADVPGIQRAVIEDLCNVCAAEWLAICNLEYWKKIQKKYEEDMCYWRKELGS